MKISNIWYKIHKCYGGLNESSHSSSLKCIQRIELHPSGERQRREERVKKKKKKRRHGDRDGEKNGVCFVV